MSHRIFTDSTGTDWQVWDVRPTTTTESIQLRSEYAEGWLAFESSLGRRRLVPIPTGWEQWAEDQLCLLCSKALEQPPRRRLVE
jgi:hypothetical protein